MATGGRRQAAEWPAAVRGAAAHSCNMVVGKWVAIRAVSMADGVGVGLPVLYWECGSTLGALI
jgi:hypothetical protein